MKHVLFALTLAATTSLLAACAEQSSTAASQDAPAAAKADDQTLARAQELMTSVFNAYRNAPAITDTVTAEVSGGGSKDNWTTKTALGPGTDGSVAFDMFTIVSSDGKLYILREGVDDKYFATGIDGSMDKTLRKVFGEPVAIRIPLAMALRNPESAIKVLERLTMGMLTEPKVTGVSTVTDASGRSVEQISFESPMGKGTANVDPKTHLVQDVQLTIAPPNAPEGFSVTANYKMTPQVHEKLPTPIAFDPGTRSSVDTLKNLQPKPMAIGDIAPDFTLRTLDGETVTLSQLKGSVVVLDFWATWCGPCRMALPSLQKFYDWSKDSGKPVKVFALNTWERAKTDEAKTAGVQKFWTDKAFTMPTLMDLDGSVATRYQVSSIPRTFVIGPDGAVRQIHVGFAQTMAEDLQKEALELLSAKP